MEAQETNLHKAPNSKACSLYLCQGWYLLVVNSIEKYYIKHNEKKDLINFSRNKGKQNEIIQTLYQLEEPIYLYK